jgi:hypothetical protein
VFGTPTGSGDYKGAAYRLAPGNEVMIQLGNRTILETQGNCLRSRTFLQVRATCLAVQHALTLCSCWVRFHGGVLYVLQCRCEAEAELLQTSVSSPVTSPPPACAQACSIKQVSFSASDLYLNPGGASNYLFFQYGM